MSNTKPNVLVLRAPGTNCDVETAYAFELAGAKAERIHGVIDAHFSPRTHEVIVRYDARRTTAHHIRHIMDSHHPHGRY